MACSWSSSSSATSSAVAAPAEGFVGQDLELGAITGGERVAVALGVHLVRAGAGAAAELLPQSARELPAAGPVAPAPAKRDRSLGRQRARRRRPGGRVDAGAAPGRGRGQPRGGEVPALIATAAELAHQIRAELNVGDAHPERDLDQQQLRPAASPRRSPPPRSPPPPSSPNRVSVAEFDAATRTAGNTAATASVILERPCRASTTFRRFTFDNGASTTSW